VSLEFRSKMAGAGWRRFWDWAFFAGSASATLLFGWRSATRSSACRSDAHGDFTGTLLDQLNPYALLVGVFAVATFAMHGALFLYLKTRASCSSASRPGCGGPSACSSSATC